MIFQINKRVLEVVEALWELGGDMAEIPPRFDAPLPEPGPEGRTPHWIRAVRRVRKMNAVRD